MPKYIISKFVKIFKKNNEYAIFNANNLEIFIADINLVKILRYIRTPRTKKEVFLFYKTKNLQGKTEKFFNVLLKNKFIVCANVDEDKLLVDDYKNYILNTKNKIGKEIKLNALRIILTEKCNLKCDYCFVQNKSIIPNPKDMDWKELKKGIDLLVSLNEKKDIELQFFGGEPLIKFDLIKKATKYANSLMKDKKIKNVFYGITTNATLLKEEHAEFFNKNNFLVSVSLDGWEDLHNIHRKYGTGKSCFDDTVRGLDVLKKNKCMIGVLFTPSEQNINSLATACKYIVKDLGLKYITINTPQPIKGNWNVSGKIFSRELKKCFVIAKRYNAIINHFGTRVLFSINNKTKMILGCSKFGNHYTATLTPDGFLSPCIVSWEHEETLTPVDKFNYLGNFTNWKLTEPYFFKKCYNCVALNVCGGPCPLEIYELKKTNKPIDHERCNFFKDFIKWAVWYTE